MPLTVGIGIWLLGRRLASTTSSSLFLSIEEALEVADAGRMTQLAQGLGFDLANAFASDVVHLADFLERPLVTIEQAEAHLQNLALALGQAGQHVSEFFLQQAVARHVRWVFGRLV